MSYLQKLHPIQTGTDNKILRKKSIPLKEIDEDLLNFASDLMELMREYDGVGLAAPQIGENIRMIATTQWKISKGKSNLMSETIMINPVIINASKEMELSKEACLSLPGLEGKVKRHLAIEVAYIDIQGKEQRKKFKHLNAFIVQHEIDHLEGILYIDKVVWKVKEVKKWK